MGDLAAATIVVTGGKGFVGEYVVRAVQQRWPGATVEAWDMPDVDITDADALHRRVAEVAPNWVIHLAALAAVGESFNQRDEVRRVNVDGARNVLVAARAVGATVLAVSSADLYGLKANEYHGEPIPELPLVDALPQNPYAESKLAMERMIEDEFNDFVVRVRPFPHIGPRQRQGFVTADFAAQIAAIETGRQEPTIHVGNLDPIRDFTDVRDVAYAYCLLLEHGAVGDVYHVASGTGVPIQSILDQLLAQSSVQIEVVPDAARQRSSDVPALVGDATKLRQLTGWQPEIPLEKSLREILQQWRRAS